MTDRERTTPIDTADAPEEDAVDAEPRDTLRHSHAVSSGLAERIARPRTLEEVEGRYVAARDTWTAAMRQAASGRPADMAALAIAQEAYEAALEERNRWTATRRLSVPVEPEHDRGIEAVVGQELSWRRVHELEEEPRPSGLRGLVRRISGR